MFKDNKIKVNTFRKPEKLCSEKTIETLFCSGKSFISYPIRVVFLTQHIEVSSEKASTSVLISVSKRRLKKAINRNLIKRRIRESYRINKQSYNFIHHINIAFIYVGNGVNSFTDIEKAIQKAAKILNEKIGNK